MNGMNLDDFLNFLGNFYSNDNEIRNNTVKGLQEMNPSMIPTLALVFNQNIDDRIKILAIQRISLFLKPSDPLSYTKICEGYSENPEFSGIIIGLCQKGIQNPNEVIRNITSELIALVIGIEKDKSLNMLNDFLKVLKSKSHPLQIILNFIRIFIEVTNLKNFSRDLRSPPFLSIYTEVIIFCQKEILLQTGIPFPVYEASCQFIRNIVDKCPEIFPGPNEVVSVLNSLLVPLQTGETRLVLVSHEIMLNLIKRFYSHSNFFMKALFDNVYQTMIHFQDKESILSISLEFWRNVGEMEKSNNSNIICLNSFKEISGFLMNLLKTNGIVNRLISTSSRYDLSEDVLIHPFYDSLVETFSMFFNSSNGTTFSIIASEINSTLKVLGQNIEEDSAFYILTLLLAIVQPINGPKEYLMFLKSHLEFVLTNCQMDFPPKIRTVSLYILKNLIEYQPLVIQQKTSFETNKEINRILNLMNIKEEDFDPKLVSLYCMIICKISKFWADSSYNSQLFNFFDIIKINLESFFDYSMKTSNINLLFDVSHATSDFILNAYNPDTIVDKMLFWFEEENDHLSESIKIVDPNLRMAVQSVLCSIISAFIQQIPYRIIMNSKAKYQGKISNEIYISHLKEITCKSLVNLENCLLLRNSVFDDASLALSHLINSFPDCIPIEKIEVFLSISFEALRSNQPPTINSSSILIGTLFKHFFNIINSKVEPALNELINLFNGSFYNRIVHKYLLSAIGNILSISFDSFFIDHLLYLDDNLRVIINNILSLNIDESNFEYGNELLQGVCVLFKGYACAFMINVSNINELQFISSPQNPFGDQFYKREQKQILTFCKIAAKILKLKENLIENETLLAFMNAFEVIVSKCSKKNNLNLSNKFLFKLLKICSDSKEEKIKVKASELENKIK